MGPGAALEHRTFADFAGLLRAGDVLVLNETRVVRARLRALREGGGGAELLLLRPRAQAAFDPAAREWLALVRPGRKLRAGTRLQVGPAGATIVDVLADGPRVVRFDEGVDVGALLEAHGEVPLPPYVGRGRRGPRRALPDRVRARSRQRRRADRLAALHARDPGRRWRARGVELVPLVLDVGIGDVPADGRRAASTSTSCTPSATRSRPRPRRPIAAAKREGRRVIAAGTTVLRALEGAALARRHACTRARARPRCS